MVDRQGYQRYKLPSSVQEPYCHITTLLDADLHHVWTNSQVSGIIFYSANPPNYDKLMLHELTLQPLEIIQVSPHHKQMTTAILIAAFWGDPPPACLLLWVLVSGAGCPIRKIACFHLEMQLPRRSLRHSIYLPGHIFIYMDRLTMTYTVTITKSSQFK